MLECLFNMPKVITSIQSKHTHTHMHVHTHRYWYHTIEDIIPIFTHHRWTWAYPYPHTAGRDFSQIRVTTNQEEAAQCKHFGWGPSFNYHRGSKVSAWLCGAAQIARLKDRFLIRSVHNLFPGTRGDGGHQLCKGQGVSYSSRWIRFSHRHL